MHGLGLANIDKYIVFSILLIYCVSVCVFALNYLKVIFLKQQNNHGSKKMPLLWVQLPENTQLEISHIR